ncbi:MAG TPA: DUF4350 domain-containing protein [Coleofasciculaceae cyanobacterium]
MKLSNRRLWILGAIAIIAIILITLLAAPGNNKLNSGSTYNRAPDGYGAWYAFMAERNTPVQRWRKPFEDLAKNQTFKPPITLLQIQSGFNLTGDILSEDEQNWVEKGNTLVRLGVSQPVTEAPFTTLQPTDVGNVKIDTGRRALDAKKKRLSDSFGAIVWEETVGNGKIIYATTPHLAANAYQDFRGNYEFLAQLATRSPKEISNSPNSILVDEYIHGYKDKEVLKREQKQDVFAYLANTPLFPAFIQGLVFLLVVIWAGNRRFGQPVTLSAPTVDNSKAYIQALAGVLQKAQSTEFILDAVGKEEQLQLQKVLFLGKDQIEQSSLIDAWVQQTGRPASELEQLLSLQSRKRRMSETDLLTWLSKWQQIRRHLSF